MKSFIVFVAVIALASAGHDDKKEKRGVASGYAYAPAPVVAKSVGYAAPAVGYAAGPVGYAGFGGYAAPAYAGYAGLGGLGYAGVPAFAGPVGYAGYAHGGPVGYAGHAHAGPVGYAGYAHGGPAGYAHAAPLAVHDAVKASAPQGYSNQIPAAAIRNVETVGVTKTITPVVTKTTTYNTHSEPALSVGRVEGYTQHAHGAPKFAPVQYNTQYSTYANPTVGVNGPVTYSGPAVSQAVGVSVGSVPVAAAPVHAYAGQAIGLGGFGYAHGGPVGYAHAGYAHAAPAGYSSHAYAAPVAAYGPPAHSYGAPAHSYGAPAHSYGAPAVVSQHSYAAPAVTVTSKGGY